MAVGGNTLEQKKFLLTGAAGFIGSNLAHFLTRFGHSVVVFDKLTYAGNLASLDGIADSQLTFIKGDICDTELVCKTLHDYDIDAVFHLAAESHVDRSIDGPSAFIETNINGTFSMLTAARSYYETLPTEQKSKFRFLTTIVCLALPGILIFTPIHDAQGNVIPAWKAIWPLFGAMNQLLAVISLLVVYLWQRSKGKRALYIAIPMVLVAFSAITELCTRAYAEFFVHKSPNYLIGITALFLAVFALLIASDGIVRIFKPVKNDYIEETKVPSES